MDYCDICIDPPRPLLSRVTGKVRVDAMDGNRRLLGELLLQDPVRLHFVEVNASKRAWSNDGRVLHAVTVYNQSSLPLTKVTVVGPQTAFLDGTVRVNGSRAETAEPGEGVDIQGLGPGCAVAVTWEAEVGAGPNPEYAPMEIHYEYLFCGEVMRGVTCI